MTKNTALIVDRHGGYLTAIEYVQKLKDANGILRMLKIPDYEMSYVRSVFGERFIDKKYVIENGYYLISVQNESCEILA